MEGYRMHPQPAHLPFVAPYHHPHHPLHQQPPRPAQHPQHHLHHLHHLPQHHLINYSNAPLPSLPLPHHHHHHHHHHHQLPQHAYLRPITPPPSPHDPTYAASSASSGSPSSNSLSSSTSTVATSQWDRQSVSSAATSTDDRARTPRPTGKVPAEVEGGTPHERFLLITSVPQDSTNDSLRSVFRPFGDLLGIYKLFLKDGIVILAFYDSRQCLNAHQYLNQHHLLPPTQDLPSSSPMSSQLLTVGQVASLIGDCEFIREAEGVLTIHAEAFVNGILLQRLLEQYGELCLFQSLDPNGLLYKCEFYDARHAHSAMSDINASTSYPLGVPLKTTLDRSASSQNTMSLPPALLNIVSHHHHSSPAPPDHAAYMFPPTPTTPHYPQLGGSGGGVGTSMEEEDEVEVERLLEENGKHPSSTSFASASTLTARRRRGLDPLRGRHDTIHLPAGPPRLTAHSNAYLPASSQSPASNDKHGHPNTRSRRSSTGTSVVPGEDTPFALEKFRASLAVVSGGAGASSHNNTQSNSNVNGSNGPGSLGLGLSSSSASSVEDTSVVDGLGLGLKIKETGAGLMLVDDLDGMGPPSSAGRMDLSDHVQGSGGSESPFRRGRTTFRAQQMLSTTTSHRSTAAQQGRRPSKIALPPFMGPLPLPSPLPLPTFWSASSGVPGGEEGGPAAARRRSAIPFPFGKGNEVSSGGQVLYNSEGALDGSSPNTMPGTKATGPPLRPFNAHIGPRLRTSRLQGQRSSPNSPTTPTTPSDNTITNGGTIPPLYAAANRPLLPLSARTALSQTRDPPSPRNTVDLDKIASGMDTRTTIMIKNVPSRMTLSDMEAFINKVCEREYDFLYLRMDFVTGNNVGYAFVNFIEVSSLLKFLQTYLGKRWNLYSSDKVMYAAYATYQGKAALVTKFQNSSILDREDQVKPHIYHSSGEDKGLPEPFPPPNDSARKARSMAAASEHGLFSRMEYNRRQQLSQNPSPSSSSQPLSPTAPKLFASSPLAARSQMSPSKLRPITIPQSIDGSDHYFDAPLNSRSSSSYASPQGLASPQQHTPTAGRTKPNPSFGAGRSSARRGSEGPQTAMFGRRASATLIPSP